MCVWGGGCAVIVYYAIIICTHTGIYIDIFVSPCVGGSKAQLGLYAV